MCAVPNMAVFCSSLTSRFPGMLLTYFLNKKKKRAGDQKEVDTQTKEKLSKENYLQRCRVNLAGPEQGALWVFVVTIQQSVNQSKIHLLPGSHSV